ncbi:hypothetical protein BU197_07205 [Streptomyces sp. CBMA291]|nr:hypothetical protein [Streptomyces sp. CBMA291]MBD0714496.1 hypothetical protein [Streptomyces sp. CBMA370]
MFTSTADARAQAPGVLGDSIALALTQEPGPSQVWGVRVAAQADYAATLNVVGSLDVQLVAIAGTPLAAAGGTPTDAIAKLAEHVTGPFSDGLERMGIAMLAKGASDPAVVTGSLATSRMVYVAHNSSEDVAAAVAGTIAGYEPHVSMLLKPVKVSSDPFTPQQLIQLNGSEAENSGGPAGKGVNWLVQPSLIPGESIHLGEGYTGAPGDKKYIDIVRTIDDITFRLKASLIATIGELRISRSGLRALRAEMEAVLEPLRQRGVIEGYEILLPILVLLDKPQPTDAERKLVNRAQDERAVEAMVTVDYAGALHRLNITLKFE